MKVAMWALAIVILGVFGVVMINLFGNITVTDQLNYTTMKNAVEASMHDAIDENYYRVGFCLCTNNKKTSGKWVFNNSSEYELKDITFDNDKETCVSSKQTCEVMHGEYRINKTVFSESIMRRFAEMVNNNKDYEIVIQDIIEYPPKVSVRISSKDKEYSTTDKDAGGYTIVNQIDAILESNGVVSTVSNPSVPDTATNSNNNQKKMSSLSLDEHREGCYYQKSSWTYCWGTAASCGIDYRFEDSIRTKENCRNVCFCQKGSDKCGIWADRLHDPEWYGYEYADLVNGECRRPTEEDKKEASCKWYAVVHDAYCENGGKTEKISCEIKAGPYNDEKRAINATSEIKSMAQSRCMCRNNNSKVTSIKNVGYTHIVKRYTVKSETGGPICTDIYANSAESAIAACKECKNRVCTATCS